MTDTHKHRTENSHEHAEHAHQKPRIPPDEVEALKATLAQLREDLARLASHAVDTGKAGVEAVRSSAGHAVDGLKERASDLKDRGAALELKLEDQIAEHPIAATLLAFSAGFIVARMLRRR